MAFKLMHSAAVAPSLIAIGRDWWLMFLLLPLGVALLLPKQLNDVARALAIGALIPLVSFAWAGVFFGAIFSLNRHNETIRYVLAASLLTALIPVAAAGGVRSSFRRWQGPRHY